MKERVVRENACEDGNLRVEGRESGEGNKEPANGGLKKDLFRKPRKPVIDKE